VIPELTAHKAAAVQEALEVIEGAGTNVRVAPPEERAELRELTWGPASAAYVAMAGEAGEALLATYDAAIAELD